MAAARLAVGGHGAAAAAGARRRVEQPPVQRGGVAGAHVRRQQQDLARVRQLKVQPLPGALRGPARWAACPGWHGGGPAALWGAVPVEVVRAVTRAF
jgi:hypothetical protein